VIKSDSALKTEVVAELAWDPAIKETAVGVAVKDGLVTLTGHLDTYGEKDAAMLGCDAEMVLRSSPVPVLLVREPATVS